MQPNIIERVWRQDKMVNVDVLNGFVFTGEVGAHKFVISGKNVNTPVDISGTITANFKNADGVLVPLTGTIEGGKAVVVLSRECYAVEGPFSLMIFADTVCIYAAIANAINSSGEVIAYPTASIPSIQELIEEVQDVIASIPQDYSALNQSVTDLKSAVNQLINQKTISAAGSGNNYIDYPIENGKTYRFSIQSTSTVTIATVSSTNTTIENIGSIVPPSGYIDFTAGNDAPKVLMYFRAAGTGVISEKGLVISNINDEITAIKNRLTELNISVDSAGNNYFDYPVTSGKMYLVETSSSAVVSVATVTTGGATIQNVGDFPATANARKVFKASSNANRILFYFRAAGTGSIKLVDEMSYLWANKVWSSYGDSISWLYGWQTIVNNNLLFANYVRNGKPGARISWLNVTFGIDNNGIYTTGTAADTVHESMCAYDRIVKTIPADIPLIFAMGGTNDFLSNIPLGDLTFDTTSETDTAWKAENPVGDYDITTFKGGLASMLMKLQHARPNALIVFGTLLNGIGAETGVNQYTEEVNTAGLKPSDYANAEKEVCAVFGVPMVDVFSTCGISVTNRATYLSDTVHPNNYGLNMLARCVTDGFKGIIPRY